MNELEVQTVISLPLVCTRGVVRFSLTGYYY